MIKIGACCPTSLPCGSARRPSPDKVRFPVGVEGNGQQAKELVQPEKGNMIRKSEPSLPYPSEPILRCLEKDTDVLRGCDQVFLDLYPPKPSPPCVFHPEADTPGKAPLHEVLADAKIPFCLP